MKILNDTYAINDLIGQKIYNEGIIEVIKSVETNGSFTIGVYGEWGSGKTSLLKQIQKKLDYDVQSKNNEVLTVWFNPWQFVSDEHLIIPFFHTIISNLASKKEESKFRDIKNNIEKFILKVSNIPMALLYGMELEFKIPFLLNSKLVASKSIDYQNIEGNKIDKSYETSSITEISKKYDSIYYDLINILKEAITLLDRKIVIFIDDLDRTLPEKAIQLLEGLKVLFDLPNVIFIIGADKQIIQSGIRLRYKDVYDNQEMLEDIENKYLHKIIQFPFTLPSANSEKLKENIIKNNLQHIPDANKYVDLIFQTLGNNPRDLKRFINTISFYHYIAQKRFFDDYKPSLLIKISLIQYLFDKLFRQLEKAPYDLIRLEKLVNEANKKSQDSLPIEPYLLTQNIQPTGITKIDKWLGEKTLFQIHSILSFGDSAKNSFNNKDVAQKYILLTAPSKSNVSIQTNDDELSLNIPLIDEIKNRMVFISSNVKEDKNNKKEKIKLSIPYSFYIDKYLVTQSLFEKIMKYNPSFFKGDDNPVENITWYDAMSFCNNLSLECGFEPVYSRNEKGFVIIDYKKTGFRMLNELEWEYTCGTIDIEHIDSLAFFQNNSKKQTHEVGLLNPNKFGLYDMLGNVWEWCNDNFSPDFDTYKVNLNEKSLFRVIRGGSWTTPINRFKKGARDKEATNTKKTYIGFRICIQNINI